MFSFKKSWQICCKITRKPGKLLVKFLLIIYLLFPTIWILNDLISFGYTSYDNKRENVVTSALDLLHSWSRRHSFCCKKICFSELPLPVFASSKELDSVSNTVAFVRHATRNSKQVSLPIKWTGLPTVILKVEQLLYLLKTPIRNIHCFFATWIAMNS